eukprot:GHVP01009355.1.p1 GENE.GHVP01009355.1~~GHVP01009355.1.p1  ORF type:complete len:314 (+),score=34.70 GHVP01009355.1:385-1326(+)
MLRGVDFKVRTDHQALRRLMDAQYSVVARWALLLSEYTFRIEIVPGSSIPMTDLLSRNTDDHEEELADRASFPSTLVPAKSDENISHVALKWCQFTDCVADARKIPDEEEKRQILRATHLAFNKSHLGWRRMEKLLHGLYEWKNLQQDCKNYAKNCLHCARRAPVHRKPWTGQLLAEAFNNLVCMDVTHRFLWKGVLYNLVTIIDISTRWLEVSVIEEESSATMLKHLYNLWVCRFGYPVKLITDNAPGFKSEEWQEAMQVAKIDYITSSPYYQLGNSVIESPHRFLRQTLAKMDVESLSSTFQEAIQFCLFA